MSFESDSWAGYVDVETDLTDRLSGAVALRYEDYDEFGDTTDWKVSGRYQFTDAFAIRATANTGFRAPTPGQVNTLNVTTTSDSSGNLIPNGTYPVAQSGRRRARRGAARSRRNRRATPSAWCGTPPTGPASRSTSTTSRSTTGVALLTNTHRPGRDRDPRPPQAYDQTRLSCKAATPTSS